MKVRLTKQELMRRYGVPGWLFWAPWWLRVIVMFLAMPVSVILTIWEDGLKELLIALVEIPLEIRYARQIDKRVKERLTNG